jgi:hypothetical protein
MTTKHLPGSERTLARIFERTLAGLFERALAGIMG